MKFKDLIRHGGVSALAAAMAVTALPTQAWAAAERPQMREREHSRGSSRTDNWAKRQAAGQQARSQPREARQQRAEQPQQRQAAQQSQQQRAAAQQRAAQQRSNHSDRGGQDWNRGDRRNVSGATRSGRDWSQAQRNARQQSAQREWSRQRNDDRQRTERNRSYRDDSRNRTYRSGSHSYRDGNRSGNYRNHHRWDRTWRNNNRYNWHSYRNQYRDRYRLGRYYAPYRDYRYNRLSIGLFLGSGFYSSRYWITDPWYYRLPPAYGEYRWIRYYDDALLVDIYTGEVVDVIYDFFW